MKLTSRNFHRYFPVCPRDEKWGLYVTTAGECRAAPHSTYPSAGHPDGFAFDWKHGRVLDSFALIYVSGGRGKFECGSDLSESIGPGDAFLLFPGVWHRYAPDPEFGWNEYWLGFDGEIPRRWLRHKFISPKTPLLRISPENAVLANFSCVMQSIRENRPALQQILAGATAALLGLFYSAQQTLPAVEAVDAHKVALGISRIQTEFASDLDMKQLAQKLGVSYSWFRAKFVAHTGLAPHQYLLGFRLIQARRLLTETHLTVKEIAVQIGFGDEHYFSRLFRQKMDRTPSQWRIRSRRGSKREPRV